MTLLEYVIKYKAINEFEANGIILAGKVTVNNNICTSCKYNLKEKDRIIINYNKKKYVTRSGYKLEAAINNFHTNIKGRVCLDIGASEGGFTDCLLQKGADLVFAADVAYGILNWKIRSNSKVVPIERKNAKKIVFNDIGQLCDIITMDVSFISTRSIIPQIIGLLKIDGEIIILFKPQFELSAKKVYKNGYVKPEDLIKELVIYIEFMKNKKVYIDKICYSPIKGNNGAIEFLLHMSLDKNIEVLTIEKISQMVFEAYDIL